MTVECQNCGEIVSDEYARVFARADELRCCPFCPDKIRDPSGYVRDARSSRRGSTGTDPVETVDVGGEA